MSHARDKHSRAAAGTSILTTKLPGQPVLARTACPTQATSIVCNHQCCSAGTAYIHSLHCACQLLPFAYCLAFGVQAIGTTSCQMFSIASDLKHSAAAAAAALRLFQTASSLSHLSIVMQVFKFLCFRQQ